MDYVRQDTKRLRDTKKIIDPWTIYLWEQGDKYYGASPVVTKDGIKEVYGAGWLIEPDPQAKKNERKHQSWRAKVQVKNLLNNTLNIINWYGKKALDNQGNIDPERVKYLESGTAFQAVKNNVDMDDLYKIRKFPVKEITFQEARDYKLV